MADHVEVPGTMFGRGLGLMFRRSLPAGHAMWIDPCNGIHMFWMNFAIDAVFLDRAQRVVKVYRRLGRWQVVPLVFGARSVVELAVLAAAVRFAPRERRRPVLTGAATAAAIAASERSDAQAARSAS
jgi:uncharacterized membrane protein (UPF0127 family)